MVNIYSDKEIEILKQSGKILSDVLYKTAKLAKAGVSTHELDQFAEKEIRAAGGEPAFLDFHEPGMRPYPASLCTSINEELVHCIPYKDRVLADGDVVSLDLGVRYKKMNTDMAVTVIVGDVSNRVRKLVQVTQASLEGVIKTLRPGLTLGDVGATVQSYAEKEGFSVIRDLVGHGVGHNVHEDPQVPNFGTPGKGLELKAGMVLAIEPMFSIGHHKIAMCADGWGIRMADGSVCAHFEKTVAITPSGYAVLTP